MVNYKYKDLFFKSHVDKQLRITTDDGLFVATNEDIHFEDFELTESLCSDSELRFGSCEASVIKFQIRNAFIPLAGKWLTVTETLDGNTDVPFQYGRYKVFSDKPTADREYRDIVAYDAMYDILGADVAAWYNGILPNKDSTVTMKQFRELFIRHFGLIEVIPKGGLINDNMTVERTIEPEQISGKDVITAICEINGCFGHIGRDGKFHYIYLTQYIQGLYPRNDLYPANDLFPKDPKSTRMGSGTYKKCQYEDYEVQTINKLQIKQEENDIGCIYETGDNAYVIEDNFLVYGKSAEELNEIAKNIYNKISGIIYRPFSAECVGNPCFEAGEPLRFLTKYEIIESYILSRTLKGIQNLNDSYSSKGTERRLQNVNSVQKSIVQLKGKTNILIRNVGETRSEIKDVDKRLSSEILQNATEIALRVRKDNVIASINLSPETITLEAQRIDLKGLVNAEELVSKFATISTLNATTANLNNLIAQKATITDLDATNLRVQNLEIGKLSVSDFNAEKASLESLIAQKIDATTVKAQYMEVTNWTTAGKIKADKIETNSLIIGASQIVGTIGIWVPYNFNYETITYVGKDGSVNTQRIMTGVAEERHAHVVRVD